MSWNLRANFDPVARHHLQICILYFNQELKDNTSHVKIQIHARKISANSFTKKHKMSKIDQRLCEMAIAWLPHWLKLERGLDITE